MRDCATDLSECASQNAPGEKPVDDRGRYLTLKRDRDSFFQINIE